MSMTRDQENLFTAALKLKLFYLHMCIMGFFDVDIAAFIKVFQYIKFSCCLKTTAEFR